MEIWKDIKDFEGMYLVSNLGNVKSLPKKRVLFHGGSYYTQEILLKPKVNSKGYIYFGLSNNCKSFSRFQHKLIAEAFIPNPLNKDQINHINCDKKDNRIENLEWCNNSENQLHSYKNGKIAAYKNKYGKNHNQSKPVTLSKAGQVIEFENISRASEFLGCTIQAVSMVLRGINSNCKGYKCNYK